MQAYTELESRFKRMGAIEAATGILYWDARTMLPKGASGGRGEQLAALNAVTHGMMTDPAMGELLGRAGDEGLVDWQARNLQLMRRQHLLATALPERLVEALTRAATETEHAWETARPADDWKSFAPKLKTLLELVREKAQAYGAALGLSPYDAMLEAYEPGMRQARVEALFAPLRNYLPQAVPQALEKQRARGQHDFPGGPFDTAAQKALGLAVMRATGFDFAHGRLDESVHPFCGGNGEDVRLTTRYRDDDLTESLFGVLHETGHAIYEQQLPAAWRYQPVGYAGGMALHESQSLLMEMQLGMGEPFLAWLLPEMKRHFPQLADIGVEGLAAQLRHVQPGLIRVTADELTYPLHILLRTELEPALLSGDLAVDDLPAAWDEGMQRYLGLKPDRIGNGCMQDVHWAGGDIGYFPDYTIGAMAAAQLFAAFREQHPGWEADIEGGNFGALREWLRDNVHAQGQRHDTAELVERASGREFGPEAYLHHLNTRYL